jgi:hypothetical protein
MAKKADKQKKAVEKVRKSVRKAVDKGVSADLVSAAVESVPGDMGSGADSELETDAPAVTPKGAKLSGLRKYNPITLKRGYTGAEAPSAKSAGANKGPMKPDSEKQLLKKLPGKRKPPTLTLKRAKNS